MCGGSILLTIKFIVPNGAAAQNSGEIGEGIEKMQGKEGREFSG